MTSACYNCGREMKYLAKHWRGGKYNCTFPEITQEEEEIIEGLMLGDGSLSNTNSLPYFQMNMANEEFTKWLSEKLHRLGSTRSLVQTAEEIAERSRKSGWNENCTEDDCKDVYQIRTSIHPHFNKYRKWYNGGEKRFPEGLELTPLSAKMWYISDGDYKTGTTKHHKPIARITSRNESDRSQFLISLFEEHGFSPYWEDQSEKISFTVEETPYFLDWMGNSVPGFEYKWNDCL